MVNFINNIGKQSSNIYEIKVNENTNFLPHSLLF